MPGERCNHRGQVITGRAHVVGKSGPCCSLGCAESAHCNIYRPERPQIPSEPASICCALCEAVAEIRRLRADLVQATRELLILQEGIRLYRRLLAPNAPRPGCRTPEIAEWEDKHGCWAVLSISQEGPNAD